MWSQSLDFSLYMTWKLLLLFIETGSVQIRSFWLLKLHLWVAFTPLIGVDRFYLQQLMKQQLYPLLVDRYIPLPKKAQGKEENFVSFCSLWNYLYSNNGFIMVVMPVKQSGACCKSCQKRKPSWRRESGKHYSFWMGIWFILMWANIYAPIKACCMVVLDVNVESQGYWWLISSVFPF